MKKNLTMSRAKKGAAILAAAMILGGCGGQEPAETTSAPAAVEETTAEEAETEAVSEEETSEEISEEAAETEGSSEAEEAAADASEETEETEEEASEAAQSSESEGEQTEDAEGQVTPQSIYEAIGQQVELPSMIEGDDSFISNYYGINPADLDGYVFASAEEATLADSVIIMKAKSEDAVANLTASLNTVIEQKAAEMENYLPEQYDIVVKSSVKTEGTYVYLVISEDADSIEAVIQDALK